MRIGLLFGIVAMLATRADADTRPTITATVDFAVGSVDVGASDGFAAPTGHFDVGVGLGNFRLQAELGHGLWTDEDAAAANADDPEAAVPASGSFSRVGVGLRWYWMNLAYGPADSGRVGRLRLYVEGGLGAHWIAGPSVNVARNDVEVGFGMAQESPIGRLLFGGNFGLRVLIADPVDATAARGVCRGSCPAPPSRHVDVAMFVVLGLVFGR